jgi:plastocyanin
MGGLNSAQKLFLLILTIVTVISIALTLLAYQLVPSLRIQTATNNPTATPAAITVTDTPTPTPTPVTPTPTPHKKPTPTPTPLRPTPTPKPPVTKVIIIQNSGYTPKTVTVPPGSTLIFENKSSLDHTVTQTNGNTFNKLINIPAMTGTYTLKLTKPGTYKYYCKYHPFMVGTIIVQ